MKINEVEVSFNFFLDKSHFLLRLMSRGESHIEATFLFQKILDLYTL